MIQIKEIVNQVFTSKTYILYCEGQDGAWLVDIGDVELVVTFLEEKGLTLEGVFITHAHFDHIYGLPELARCYPLCKVYVTEYAKQGLASDKLNMSRYRGVSVTYEGDNAVVVHEGDQSGQFASSPHGVSMAGVHGGKPVDWKWLVEVLEKYRMKESFDCINAISVEDLGFDSNIFPYIQFNPTVKQRIINDILNTSFSEKEPKYVWKRIPFKYRRWKANEWKHELCYNESMSSSFFFRCLGEFARIATIFPANAPKYFVTYASDRIKASNRR